ncbi:hypothetical protein BC835DRAFT_110942 [Cytidiella melzeri]|nr:hypothetical protein BC835DRAFT_110942 [Cytidiella melzeri]
MKRMERGIWSEETDGLGYGTGTLDWDIGLGTFRVGTVDLHLHLDHDSDFGLGFADPSLFSSPLSCCPGLMLLSSICDTDFQASLKFLLSLFLRQADGRTTLHALKTREPTDLYCGIADVGGRAKGWGRRGHVPDSPRGLNVHRGFSAPLLLL